MTWRPLALTMVLKPQTQHGYIYYTASVCVCVMINRQFAGEATALNYFGLTFIDSWVPVSSTVPAWHYKF